MLEQAEVEGFLQAGYKLGVGTALYQDLPCLQEPGGRLVCPALVKAPVHSDSPGWGWGALSIPVSADWKELEGETRAAGPLRLSLKLQPEPDFCLICNGRAPSAATRNPLCFCLFSSFFFPFSSKGTFAATYISALNHRIRLTLTSFSVSNPIPHPLIHH